MSWPGNAEQREQNAELARVNGGADLVGGQAGQRAEG